MFISSLKNSDDLICAMCNFPPHHPLFLYFFVIHHCTFSFITAPFVQHNTLKQAPIKSCHRTLKIDRYTRNIGWLHWYGVVCWALLRPILLSSAATHKVHGALAPSVQPIKVFSVYHLYAPPPDRSVPLQWLAPQFGNWPPFVDTLTPENAFSDIPFST